MTRFALTYVSDAAPTLTLFEELSARAAAGDELFSPRDLYILTRLNETVRDVEECLRSYNFGDLTQHIYAFWLNDLCDFYLEVIKPTMRGEDGPKKDLTKLVLYACLDTALRLTHPVMPFVTEELWQRLPGRGTFGAEEKPSIMLAAFPREQPAFADGIVDRVKHIRAIIGDGRSAREQYQLGRKEAAMIVLVENSPAELESVAAQADDIAVLCSASDLQVVSDAAQVPPRCAQRVVSPTVKVFLSLEGIIEPEKEIAKLEKELEKVDGALGPLQRKLAQPDFAQRVPEEVQQKMREKCDNYTAKKDSILAAIEEMRAWAAGEN